MEYTNSEKLSFKGIKWKMFFQEYGITWFFWTVCVLFHEYKLHCNLYNQVVSRNISVAYGEVDRFGWEGQLRLYVL